MSDQLLSSGSDGPTALTPSPQSTDGNLLYDDYSDKEIEKPIILELGSSQSSLMSGTTAIPDYNMELNSPPYLHQMYPTSQESQQVSNLMPLSLYTNPYTQHAPVITPLSRAIHSSSTYPTHIPQPVCNWPPNSNMDNKMKSNIVPPPMFINYIGAREHIISRESNPGWKEKAIQIEKDYKKTACDRERTRMRDMNRAFDMLRSKLPITKPNGKKYSKIESLRIAINYINHLQQVLRAPNSEMEMLTFPNGNTSKPETINLSMDASYRRRSHIHHYDVNKYSMKDDIDRNMNHSPLMSSAGDWNNNHYVPNQWH